MSDLKDKINIRYIPSYEWYLDELDRDTGSGCSPIDQYYSKYWKEGDAEVCKHEWVNVSFNFFKEACKHCGIDKKE